MNSDGSGISSSLGRVDSPRWSPDQSKIAYVSGDGIYIMCADGSSPTLVNELEPTGMYISWSPDGSKIAYSNHTGGGQYDIFLMDVDGSNVINLTPSVDEVNGYNVAHHAPDISPDGSKIAFHSNQSTDATSWNSWDIYVMDINGANHMRLTTDGLGYLYPRWSPNGQKIAFRSSDYEIYTINVDGSNLSNITNHASTNLQPVWSPSGNQIAFTSHRDGNGEIYVMESDGSNPTRLTNHPEVDSEPDW